MKKLVLFAVAAVAISFASCGNKAAEPAQEVLEAVEQAQDLAAATDSTVANVIDSVAAEAGKVIAE